jgi:hypothetical protein
MTIEWKKLAYESDVITKALLTSKGDIIYASAAGTPAVLAIGSNAQILSVATDIPDWIDVPAPSAHTLNSHSVPDGAVDFDLQQATDLVFMTVAAEANLPAAGGTVALGQPCWATSEKTLHICVSAA